MSAMTGALRRQPATIVGAGIAGLTVAIALAQRGARVTILERADALRQVGAGLQISPNAGRVLDALGLGAAFSDISLRNRELRINDASGRNLARLDFVAHRPADAFRVVHRARLVALLEQAAREAGVTIHLDHPVDTLPDVPLLIGADGLHSVVRATLNGREVPFFTGQTAWRAIIPDRAPDPVVDLFMGPGRHLVSYPLDESQRNIVAVVERRDWQAEGWSHRDDPQNMRDAFAAFGGPVPGWLADVTETGIWGLFRHDVAATWQDGQRVILGDAAHPTLPFMAQGACLAIEDAWVLAACLDADADRPRALARYQTIRRPRAVAVIAVANANARNYHLTGPARRIAHLGLRAIGAAAPSRLLARYDWIYDHDPTADD